MDTDPEEIKRELLFQAMGNPPYFARLRNPRSRLSALEWSAYPQLHRLKYFVVIEHALDRDEQHPGIWLRPILTQPAVLTNLQARITDNEQIEVDWQLQRFEHHPIPLWLNLDWCIVHQVLGIN